MSAEVPHFGDQDLLPQLKDAFAPHQNTGKAKFREDLDNAIGQARGLGVGPETAQKVKALRPRIKSDAADVGAVESEV